MVSPHGAASGGEVVRLQSVTGELEGSLDSLPDHVAAQNKVVDGESCWQVGPLLSPPDGHVPAHHG